MIIKYSSKTNFRIALSIFLFSIFYFVGCQQKSGFIEEEKQNKVSDLIKKFDQSKSSSSSQNLLDMDEKFKKHLIRMGLDLKHCFDTCDSLVIPSFTEELSLNSLRGIQKFKKLKHLEVSNHSLFDIGSLVHLKDLEVLILSNNKIQNIEPLTKLKELRVVDLRNNQVRKIPDLNELKKLELLELNGNPIQTINDLISYSKIPHDRDNKSSNYKKGSLASCQDFEKIKACNQNLYDYLCKLGCATDTDLLQLESIVIPSYVELSHLKGLAYLKNLKKLEVNSPKAFNGDLSTISSLSKLETLVCVKCDLESIEGIKFPKSLKKIDLSRNNRLRNIDAFKGNQNILSLDLSETNFSEFQVLELMPNLEDLSVDLFYGPKYCFASRLPKLKKLKVSGKTIIDPTYKSVALQFFKHKYSEYNDELNILLKEDLDFFKQKHFNINTLSDYSILKYFPDLESITITDRDFIGNENTMFNTLSELTNLKVLTLKQCSFKSHNFGSAWESFYDFLESSKLLELTIKDSRFISNSIELPEMKNLEALTMSDIAQSTSVRFNDKNGVRNVDVFGDIHLTMDFCPKLKSLRISPINGRKIIMNYFSFFYYTPDLTELDFDRVKFINDEDFDITDSEPILANLKIFSLKKSNISKKKKREIANLLGNQAQTSSKTINAILAEKESK